ncbi:hypothetical protein [Pseudofrankia asymbiotica]|uniref:hypothetical protein n=1 Tax=Pseudofrankia asymbiotica TaxID=1834516 RepID=UPI0013043BCD|nr:hypothetical protein [Pseudofrankia asymbiotica]
MIVPTVDRGAWARLASRESSGIYLQRRNGGPVTQLWLSGPGYSALVVQYWSPSTDLET